jgi:hypothetical protein
MEKKTKLSIYDWFRLKQLKQDIGEYEKFKKMEGKKIKKLTLDNK